MSILVVDDESSNIIALTKTLSPKYTVRVAINGPDAIQTAEKHQPDLILLDIVMPDMDGYAVLAALKHSEKTRDIPVLFLTAKTDPESEAKGLRLGAQDYINKPFSQELLLKRVDMHLRMNQGSDEFQENGDTQGTEAGSADGELLREEIKKNSILIVDDESTNIVALTHILRSDYILRVAINGREALKLAEQFLPDLILLDIVMPEMDGYEVLAALKDSPKTKDIPVIFISSLTVDDDEEKGLALGASDYIGKPFSSAIVKIRVRNQIQIVNQMRVITTASRAKSDFLANMSHEIRTPMNAILGFTEIMMRDPTIQPGVTENLGMIYSAGDMLLSLINDILDLSKIEAGKFELLPSEYEVAEMIVDTANLNMIRAGSKKIEFRMQVDENMPTNLFGDELRIRQILNNLLSNAFKYTEAGEVSLTFSAEPVDGSETGEWNLVVSVGDTGQGMTPEQIKVLFDPYSRFNFAQNRSIEGAGLGMNITQNLVHMMNGDIAVTSEPGKGSVFTVRLPQERVTSDRIGKEFAQRLQNFHQFADKATRKSRFVIEPMPYGRVLIVDDTESNLFVAKGLMQPYELTVETVTSGFEAIEKISNGSVYDIIFMDHMMPRMDGVETVRNLREMGYIHPIVAKTASAVKGSRELFLSQGFDDFISKPIDTQLLDDVLKKYIRDKQSQELLEAYDRQLRTSEIDRASVYLKSQRTVTPLLVEVFSRDVLRNVTVLNAILKKEGGFDDEDLLAFTNSVHALKSALANVGEAALSSFAGRLEQAGLDRQTDLIISESARFLSELQDAVKALTSEKPDELPAESAATNYMHLHQELHVIKTACENYDVKTAKNTIQELTQQKWEPPVVNEWLSTIPVHLLSGDFEEISRTADRIMTETGHLI